MRGSAARDWLITWSLDMKHTPTPRTDAISAPYFNDAVANFARILEKECAMLLSALKIAEQAMQNNYQGDMTEAFKIVREAVAKAEGHD